MYGVRFVSADRLVGNKNAEEFYGVTVSIVTNDRACGYDEKVLFVVHGMAFQTSRFEIYRIRMKQVLEFDFFDFLQKCFSYFHVGGNSRRYYVMSVYMSNSRLT